MHAIINHRPRLAAIAAIALAVAVPTGVAIAHGTHDDGLTGAQRTVIRDATKRFRDVDTAIAAGYIPTDTCAELPGVGGMGFHFVNPALAGDAKVDPTMPEVLVYNMTDDGRFRLDAIEYFVADADQDLATDTDRPTLMGHPFDGPMEGHEPGMPIHYDLHAWVYQTNPAGELSAWNPDVSCH
ncbi:MAG TPA: hypothetical protein VMM60_06545 [Ilumatobacter sp.]|nr:hypothetical protein [Ilumatobacter sp.]